MFDKEKAEAAKAAHHAINILSEMFEREHKQSPRRITLRGAKQGLQIVYDLRHYELIPSPPFNPSTKDEGPISKPVKAY